MEKLFAITDFPWWHLVIRAVAVYIAVLMGSKREDCVKIFRRNAEQSASVGGPRYLQAVTARVDELIAIVRRAEGYDSAREDLKCA